MFQSPTLLSVIFCLLLFYFEYDMQKVLPLPKVMLMHVGMYTQLDTYMNYSVLGEKMHNIISVQMLIL